jgi:hypothetical protein
MALFNIEKFVDKINSKKKLQSAIFSIKQLYALPSRFGIYLGFAIIGGIGLSNRLENNFLLLILLFQMVIFFLSIIWSARNLIGIGLQVKRNFIFIPTKHKFIPININHKHNKFDIKIKDEEILHKRFHLPYSYIKRGKNKIEKIKISSRFPFGIIYCWTWLAPGQIIVAPKPIKINSTEDIYKYLNKYSNKQTKNDSFDYYRNSIDQDSPKRIDWKKYLSKQIKLTKISSQMNNDQCINIEANHLINNNKEIGLQIICGIILFCHQKKLHWNLSFNSHQFFSKKNDYEKAIKHIALV